MITEQNKKEPSKGGLFLNRLSKLSYGAGGTIGKIEPSAAGTM